MELYEIYNNYDLLKDHSSTTCLNLSDIGQQPDGIALILVHEAVAFASHTQQSQEWKHFVPIAAAPQQALHHLQQAMQCRQV